MSGRVDPHIEIRRPPLAGHGAGEPEMLGIMAKSDVGFGEYRRLVSLQILRFFAAALVVFAHCVDKNQSNGVQPVVQGTTLENFGAVGVDIFFVISGYIITLTAGRASTAYAFWRDRLVRVAPIYWILSAPAAAIIIYKYGVSLPVLASTVLFWPIWGKFTEPYLAVGWTLAFEFLFYFTVGLTKFRVKPVWLLGVFAVAFVAQFIWKTPILQYLGNPIILEFLMGVFLAYVGQRGWSRSALIIGLVSFACALIFGYGQISEAAFTQDASQSLRRAVVWGIPSALLIYGAVGQEQFCRSRTWLFLAALGDASYSLYLSHFYALAVAGKIFQILLFQFDTTVIELAIAVLVGWLVYRFIEVPVTRLIRRKFLRCYSERHVAASRSLPYSQSAEHLQSQACPSRR